MGFAKFEPGMRGPWPAEQYGQLVGCLGQIINSLALLSGAYGHMDRTWAKRLAENADTLHPSFVRSLAKRSDVQLMTDRRYAQLVRLVAFKSETCSSATTYDPTIRAIILPSRKQTCSPIWTKSNSRGKTKETWISLDKSRGREGR
jgi:hypothetical protein